MANWTWLHTLFPLADIELIGSPMDAKVANVLVRTMRELPERTQGGEKQFMVRVAPHNVAKFRGGPWIRTFTESQLNEAGSEIVEFRTYLIREVNQLLSAGS